MQLMWQRKNEKPNALLQEALDEFSAKVAREKAMLHAFETSGQSATAFADMYGWKVLDVFVSGGYEKSAQYIPKVYGKVYDAVDQKIVRKAFDYHFIITYMEMTIKKKIKNDKITHIISTHPFTGIAVSRLKEKEKIDIPIYSLITDYTVHLAHVTNEIDKYIVAHEDTDYEIGRASCRERV